MQSHLVNKVSEVIIIDYYYRFKEGLNIVNPEMKRSKNEYLHESGEEIV